MKYVVCDTFNGEIYDDIAIFNTPDDAFKYIELCAWSTNKRMWLNNPFVYSVNDDYELSQIKIERVKK